MLSFFHHALTLTICSLNVALFANKQFTHDVFKTVQLEYEEVWSELAPINPMPLTLIHSSGVGRHFLGDHFLHRQRSHIKLD